MSKIADNITLKIHPDGHVSLWVDDAEFPWDVTKADLILVGNTEEVPSVVVRILAKDVRTYFVDEPQATVDQVSTAKVGDQFELTPETAVPEGHIDVLRQLSGRGSDAATFLIRREDDKWQWSYNSDGSSVLDTHFWKDLRRAYSGSIFEIVTVSESVKED